MAAHKSHQIRLAAIVVALVALFAGHPSECATANSAASPASAVAAAAASSKAPTEQEATTCLRDLNSYLDKLGFGKTSALEPTVDWLATRDSVRAALAKLDQQLELARLNPELASEDVSLLASSADCNSEALLAVAQKLREASAPGACDQPSVDFLMVIANYDLREGGGAPPGEAALNQFARNCVDTCWALYVGSVSRGLDRALGKMASFVFSFVESLARSVRHMESAWSQASQTREIRIEEGKPQDEVDEWGTQGAERTSLDARRPGALREAVDGLKQLKVDSGKARKTFAKAVNEKYEMYARRRRKDGLPEEKIDSFFRQFFVRPCAQLVERVQAIVGRGAIYKNHIRQTLGQALADEKRENPRLDYELQMFRVCKLANQQAASITTELLAIRRRIDFQLGSHDLYDWY